ncbi:MAG: hypothetical protein K2I96_11610, partial [Lachnospiraceae bacterium]|nr:hypothetical protein [Lachnospiraceae bacterium]
MKKKIVNVLLSVAVVTTMMFTATACGSKDEGNTSANAPVENSVTDTTPSSEANEEPSSAAAADSDASGSMTAADWVNS